MKIFNKEQLKQKIFYLMVMIKLHQMPFGISALSPELTFQVKPFKNIPGVLSLTAGLRNTLGGKDKAETTVGGQWTSRPYGNIRYSIPLEGAIDKLKDLDLPTIKRKKTYNDYADDQEYDEEYTDDTPQEDTSTENNIEVNPPELQVNPNGTVLGRGDCPEGYERPCSKCRCQKIKMPQMYTDKRGTHLFGNEPIRFQSGGEQEAMNAMMKARLAYANMFGNPAAQRMINIPDQPYEFDNGDMGTHYMASMDNYAVPQIQNENGQLMLGNYGPESREAIRFDSDEDANYFAENYKDVSPGFIDLELTDNEIEEYRTEDQIEEYRKGGYIVEDISVPSLTRMQPGGLRRHNNLTPFDMITDENAHQILDQINLGNVPFDGPLFAKTFANDPKRLAKLMNDLYGIAVPVGVATGAGAMLANPYTDESPIGKYQGGGFKVAKKIIKRR
jgi:hypothetical protein